MSDIMEDRAKRITDMRQRIAAQREKLSAIKRDPAFEQPLIMALKLMDLQLPLLMTSSEAKMQEVERNIAGVEEAVEKYREGEAHESRVRVFPL